MEKSKCCGAEALIQVGGKYACKKCENYCEIKLSIMPSLEPIENWEKKLEREFNDYYRKIPHIEGQTCSKEFGELICNNAEINRTLDTVLYKTKSLIKSLLSSQSSKIKQEMIKEIKQMPSRCRRCEKMGINPYGECECSYKDEKWIKKSDVITIINNSN